MEALSLSSSGTVRIIQITDTHLGETEGERLTGVDTDESLNDVLTLIKSQQSNIDLVLVTGDVANHGTEPAYQRFKALMDAWGLPWLWLPGNHDAPELMNKLYPEHSWLRGIDLPHWQCQLLNSQLAGEVGGELADDELQRLEQQLVSSEKHQLVFLHHQPIPVGSTWIDSQQVSNGAALQACISAHDNVKAVVWGHVHQEFHENINGVDYRSTPSTCIQFAPNSDDFALDSRLPGYRWFELCEDGSYSTGVERVNDKDYGIEMSSLGY